MLSPEDISRIVNKFVDLIFSQSLIVILLLMSNCYIGYLLLQSENQVADLQIQLVEALKSNQQLSRENAQAIKENAQQTRADYESRLKDLKESQVTNRDK